MKYTDEQIMKAIECCFLNGDCSGCPAEFREYDEICVRCVGKNALEMFNRQRAELEDLREIVFTDRTEAIKNLKAEAIKEFARRLKRKNFEYQEKYIGAILRKNDDETSPTLESLRYIDNEDIDNLVREMTEDKCE